MKVAAADLLKPGLGSYTAYFCHILSVKAKRFKRRGNRLHFSTGEVVKKLHISLFHQSNQDNVTGVWVVNKEFWREKRNSFSKGIYTLHHQQWVIVVTAINGTLVDPDLLGKCSQCFWNKMSQLPNYLMVKWRTHSIVLLREPQKEQALFKFLFSGIMHF